MMGTRHLSVVSDLMMRVPREVDERVVPEQNLGTNSTKRPENPVAMGVQRRTGTMRWKRKRSRPGMKSSSTGTRGSKTPTA